MTIDALLTELAGAGVQMEARGCGSAVLVELVTGPTVCPGCCPMPPEAVAEKLVWNDELRAVEGHVDALRAVHGDEAAPENGLQTARDNDQAAPENDPQCPRCGSQEHRDTLIHAGSSVRRDCSTCGRTYGFPTWHGRKTGPEDTPR